MSRSTALSLPPQLVFPGLSHFLKFVNELKHGATTFSIMTLSIKGLFVTLSINNTLNQVPLC
jgi:hypothetical protein